MVLTLSWGWRLTASGWGCMKVLAFSLSRSTAEECTMVEGTTRLTSRPPSCFLFHEPGLPNQGHIHEYQRYMSTVHTPCYLGPYQTKGTLHEYQSYMYMNTVHTPCYLGFQFYSFQTSIIESFAMF